MTLGRQVREQRSRRRRASRARAVRRRRSARRAGSAGASRDAAPAPRPRRRRRLRHRRAPPHRGRSAPMRSAPRAAPAPRASARRVRACQAPWAIDPRQHDAAERRQRDRERGAHATPCPRAGEAWVSARAGSVTAALSRRRETEPTVGGSVTPPRRGAPRRACRRRRCATRPAPASSRRSAARPSPWRCGCG